MNANFEELSQGCTSSPVQSYWTTKSTEPLKESHKRPNQTYNLTALLIRRLKRVQKIHFATGKKRKIKDITKAGGCEGEINHWVEYP